MIKGTFAPSTGVVPRILANARALSTLVTLVAWQVAPLAAVVGCSSQQGNARLPHAAGAGVAEAQPPNAESDPVERAHELIQAAGLEIRNLQDMQAAALDSGTAHALHGHIVDVTRSRDAVLADLSPYNRSELKADVTNLESAVQAAAAIGSDAPLAPLPLPGQDREHVRGAAHDDLAYPQWR
jgi:hypothetical protein